MMPEPVRKALFEAHHTKTIEMSTVEAAMILESLNQRLEYLGRLGIETSIAKPYRDLIKAIRDTDVD